MLSIDRDTPIFQLLWNLGYVCVF